MIFQNQLNKDFLYDFIDILDIEWADYEDFEKRYGSDNNPENYAMRSRLNNFINSLGFLVKNGLVDAEKAYEIIGVATSPTGTNSGRSL